MVLDEADEMLAMGFADAMDAILSQTPAEKQVALFSATMAPNIRRIAQRHLKNPREVVIKGKTGTAANIKQSYWMVSGLHKLDALTRIVEVAEFDAMLVFVRTKQSTVELAEKLQARGFAAVALNGDIQQSMREKTVAQLKAGKFDILVATDVAARGLDVERVTHVVNFDVPYDTESYVHRIGRTGRAGRSGEAILFIAPRERNLLRLIERATRQTIEPLSLPSVDDVNTPAPGEVQGAHRRSAGGEPDGFLSQGRAGSGAGDRRRPAERCGRHCLDGRRRRAGAVELEGRIPPAFRPKGRNVPSARSARSAAKKNAPDLPAVPEGGYCFEDDGQQITYRLAVGNRHGAQPGSIVGAIANEARLHGSQINGVDIRADYTLVRLPANLPAAGAGAPVEGADPRPGAGSAGGQRPETRAEEGASKRGEGRLSRSRCGQPGTRSTSHHRASSATMTAMPGSATTRYQR